MKPFLLASVISFSTAVVHAQSLDIGGVELHLGQKVDDALRSLSSYQVQYTGSSWFVTQKVGGSYEVLGSISAKNGALSFISKQFDISGNIGTPEAYTRASKELRRRGGTACLTREVEYSDGLIREIETRCGSYKLAYYMPATSAGGARSLGGVAITVLSP